MNKQAIKLSVNQIINYHPQGQDHFNIEAKGNYIQLSTYDKITYTDHQDDDIEIKWQYSPNRYDIQQLEIRQSQGTLVFSQNTSTHNPYVTAQGTWDLIIETKTMQLKEVDNKSYLQLTYLMRLGEEKLGDYDFQLIFCPQEGNINSRGKEVPHGIE